MSDGALTGFRLSPAQERLWRLAAEAEPGAFAARVTLSAPTPWDNPAVAAALFALAERHEILRTEFRALAEMSLPLQRPLDPAPVPIGAADAARFHALVDGTRLTLAVPPLCADGPSLVRLAAEFCAVYAGREHADEPMQFCDLAEWQHEMQAGAPAALSAWTEAEAPARIAPRPALPFLRRQAAGKYAPRRMPCRWNRRSRRR